jgi:hypothetical protein
MGTRHVLPGSHVCKRHREPFLTPRPMTRFMALPRYTYTREYEDHHHSIVLPGEVLFRASYWYVSIQKLPFSSRLLSACGGTPGHVSVLLERSAWECSGSMRKNKETCER